MSAVQELDCESSMSYHASIPSENSPSIPQSCLKKTTQSINSLKKGHRKTRSISDSFVFDIQSSSSICPPFFLEKLADSAIPVTSLSNTSITCSSINSKDDNFNLIAHPLESPLSVSQDALCFTSGSLVSTAVGSTSPEPSHLHSQQPIPAGFSLVSTRNSSYLDNQIHNLPVNYQNPACMDSNDSHLTNAVILGNDSFADPQNQNASILPTNTSIQLPPKSSELRSLFFNGDSTDFDDSLSAHSSDNNSITDLTSPCNATLTNSNISSSTKQDPDKNFVSNTASNRRKKETHSQSFQPTVKREVRESSTSSSNTCSDFTGSSVSNDFSCSLSSKSSIASFTPSNDSPIHDRGDLSSPSLITIHGSTTTLNKKSVPSTHNQHDKYSTMPNMRSKKSSPQSLLKKRSSVVRRKSSRSLKSKPSMLDLIDNNKLTTFPQVYNTFVGTSGVVEHSSSPVASNDSFLNCYHTFSGIGRPSSRKYVSSNTPQDKYFDGETSVSSLMMANNMDGRIVFVEDYFDEIHLHNKTARNFSSANFSSANFGSDSPTGPRPSNSKARSALSKPLTATLEDTSNSKLVSRLQGDGTKTGDSLRHGLNKGLQPPFTVSSPNKKLLPPLEPKNADSKLDSFNEILATPSRIPTTTGSKNSSPFSTVGSTVTVEPVSTPRQSKSKRNVSSSSQCQLSPFSTMRRGSMIKTCVHCHQQLYELSNTQYLEFVCNDCAGFHQLLSGNETKKPRKLPKSLDLDDHALPGPDGIKGYNMGPPLVVKKVRNTNTPVVSTTSLSLSPYNGSNPHRTAAVDHKFKSTIDLPASAYIDWTSASNGRHTIGPNSDFSAWASASMVSLGSFVSNFSRRTVAGECQNGMDSSPKRKMEWYASMRRKLRWRWRISGLLPQGMVSLGKL